MAQGFSSGAPRVWRSGAALPVAVAILLTVYRPWDPVWRGVRDAYGSEEVLAATPCKTPIPAPGPAVVSADPQVVTLLNPSGRPIRLEYLSHRLEDR